MQENKKMTIDQLLEAMAAEMGRSPETMVLLSQINESAVLNMPPIKSLLCRANTFLKNTKF